MLKRAFEVTIHDQKLKPFGWYPFPCFFYYAKLSFLWINPGYHVEWGYHHVEMVIGTVVLFLLACCIRSYMLKRHFVRHFRNRHVENDITLARLFAQADEA